MFPLIIGVLLFSEPIGSKYTPSKTNCNKNIEPNGFLCYFSYMGRNKCFNRTDVLEAAGQLFWKKGYADTSLSDLEKATGVNKSGLYSEFKDKDDIFLQSLKYYQENNVAYSILEREPLGWKNIENFLKESMICKGQKGCYLSNTMREYSIIPQKVKNLIEQNGIMLNELVLKNVAASGTKKDPEMITNMILTFASGISLKLNMVKAEELVGEVDNFLNLIRD
jgi:AcrR family transcriptional regulator